MTLLWSVPFFFNCIYVYFNLPTSRRYIYHEQIVLIKYAALTTVCIYQFYLYFTGVIKWIFYQIKFDRAWLRTYVVVIVVAFCYLQIRLLYCVHVGIDNLKKKIFENKFWKLLKYIIGTGIEQENQMDV